MRLWTIQTYKAYEKLLDFGVVYGEYQWGDTQLREKYLWMVDEMVKRIGDPPYENILPLWAWYQYEGKQKAPDLRGSGFLAPGVKGVRIEFEIPLNDVVLSDFELWHYVLNNWYLADSKVDMENFDLRLKAFEHRLDRFNYPKEIQKEIENSWQRIFDLEFQDDYITGSQESRSIQATFWKLRIESVKSVTTFTAR